MTDNSPDYTDNELAEMDTDTSVDVMKIKRQPINAYVEYRRKIGGEESNINQSESVLREFAAYLTKQYDEHPCNVSDNHIKEFNQHLKGGKKLYRNRREWGDTFDLSDRSRERYLDIVTQFYNWLKNNNVVSENPASIALSDLNKKSGEFALGPPDRPRIEMDEMKEFLTFLYTPFQRAVFVLLLKTGIRNGEMRNIDLRDVHIDHKIYQWLLDEYDIQIIKEVENRPDTLFIQPGFTKGSVIRGEEREAGQKRSRDDGTVIPIDEELKTALLEYILSRPTPIKDKSCHPLFIKEKNKGQERVTWDSIATRAKVHALEEFGWHDPQLPTEEKVDIHYFRHYFTHNHRHMSGVYDGHMPEGVIAYIRGDADSNGTTRETTYSHGSWDDWNKKIKRPYLDGIYQFGLYK